MEISYTAYLVTFLLAKASGDAWVFEVEEALHTAHKHAFHKAQCSIFHMPPNEKVEKIYEAATRLTRLVDPEGSPTVSEEDLQGAIAEFVRTGDEDLPSSEIAVFARTGNRADVVWSVDPKGVVDIQISPIPNLNKHTFFMKMARERLEGSLQRKWLEEAAGPPPEKDTFTSKSFCIRWDGTSWMTSGPRPFTITSVQHNYLYDLLSALACLNDVTEILDNFSVAG